MAYLVVFSEGTPPQRFSLSGATIIGRAIGCDVWVDDPELSRRHCKLEQFEGKWVLNDLGSTNGTFLERRQVKCHVLKDGEAIYIGKTRLHFHADLPVASHRPSDPFEAARAPTTESVRRAMEETLAPAARRLPATAASRSKPAPKPRESKPPGAPTSLPFSRPPAKPKVDGGEVSSSWFSAVVSRLRRGK